MSKIIPAGMAALAVACSGGSGISNTAFTPGSTPVKAAATVTGFASINSPDFQTASAAIRKNGQVVLRCMTLKRLPA